MNKPSWQTKEKELGHFVKHVLCIDEHWEGVPDSAPLIKHFGSRRQFARWRTQQLEEFESLTGVIIHGNLKDLLLSNTQMDKRASRWKGYKSAPSAVEKAEETNPRGLAAWYSRLERGFTNWREVFQDHIQFLIADGGAWEMSCDYIEDGAQKSAFISRYAQISIVEHRINQEKTILTCLRINHRRDYSFQIEKLKTEPKCSGFTRQDDQEKWDTLRHIKPSDMP